jgi:hypothetical protein
MDTDITEAEPERTLATDGTDFTESEEEGILICEICAICGLTSMFISG